MSNLRENSERNMDLNKPSTSTKVNSQQSGPRSTVNNIAKEKIRSSQPRSSSRNKTNQKHKRDQQSASQIGNSSVNDLADQVNNLDVNIVLDEATASAQKKKNAKKRENRNRKKLQVQIPKCNETPIIPHSAPPGLADVTAQHDVAALQEIFRTQIAPLYPSSNVRYLENVSYHPYFQYVPVPQAPLQNYIFCSSVPVSPAVHVEPKSPQYLQNMMQHPLLRQAYSADTRQPVGANFAQNILQSPIVVQIQQQLQAKANALDSKRRKKKRKQSDEKKFDPYMELTEVEEGIKNNKLFEGILRINPKQYQHAYVSTSDRSEQDVMIEGMKNRNRALEGDIVVVQLLTEVEIEDLDEDKQQKRGKVVYIKEKVHTRTCIGNLKLMPDKNRERALFVPRDHRIPRLNIPFTSWPNNFYEESKNYENSLFLAKVEDWTDTRFAIGAVVCLIGQAGDMMSESKAILAQNDLDVTPFGPEVRDLYPRLDYTIPEEEFQLREDCRKLCLFSIDPHNCRDIDDAVTCVQLPNGNFEIGVHISDVSHFLTEDTILDAKVAEKATTIYLVERAYHMLPDELCMLCSLFPGVDKLAFSVFWEITQDAAVVSHRFSKTVINSCCQLAYEHAQAILDDDDKSKENFPELYNNFKYEDVYETIKNLGKISKTLRKNRYEGGALRIDQPKVSFKLSATSGLPESYWIYDSKESHQLIEEFMLLANMTVATRIYDDYPSLAFLRCHPSPSGYMLRQLAKSLQPMGIDLDISTAGSLYKSLLPYIGLENTDRGKAIVLNMLCAKPMTRAKYICADGGCDDDFQHYALNVPLYTHFTSPIRRYADIMVHRLLAASLKYRATPEWEVDKVRYVAAQCNKQKYNAKKAGEMSTELYTLKFIELHSPVVTEAVVVDVREKYIDIVVVAMNLNRRIFFNNDFPGTYKCIKNEAGLKLSKMEITWHKTDNLPEVAQVIEVFGILNVEMHKGDEMVKVETKLVRPE